MKKIFLGTLVLAFAFTLSACGNKSSNQQSSTTDNNTSAVAQAPTQVDNGGVINSIKDAMGLGKKMECTYADNLNGATVTAVTQVDGKNFKSVSDLNGKKVYSVMKDGVMYSWGEISGIPATKLDLNCVKDLQKNLPPSQQAAAPDQDPLKSFDNATKVSCKPVDSIDISVPTDIQFQDQCEMMKGLTKQLKDMKVPAGANVPANIPNIPGAPELQ